MAKKLDNIERDVIAAERIGYGCHYGRYKADHPYTRVEEPERKDIPDDADKRVCGHCGKEFCLFPEGRSHNSKYCSRKCYYDAAKLRAAERRYAKKEAERK